MLVVWSSNPITSVLYLISVYISCALLFLILGAEFISILLVLIYVGAVAILFLFVIMMLNQRLVETYNSLINYLPLGLAISFFFLIEMIYIIKIDFGLINYYSESQYIVEMIDYKSNIQLFTEVLYNKYPIYVYFCGFILLVAMIGAISLTLQIPSKVLPMPRRNIGLITMWSKFFKFK